jgi:hypothetical protein
VSFLRPLSFLIAGVSAAALLGGPGAPMARADGAAPKVVIIVGATEATTSTYRAFADAEYAAALRFTPNVVRVYSPNATWEAVKAAVAGAQVVIYHGHGNGWPSPYPYDPTFRTRDGFGLNAVAGAGDDNRVYYGEPYIETLPLAPNALVILANLCYAAGSSEPGQPEPTVEIARQRVDNYASAFLRAGAGAVIADDHLGAVVEALTTLFTETGTVEDLWRTSSAAHGNLVSFASQRTPGAVVELDPDTPTSGFYRALTVRPGLTTTQVLGVSSGAPTGAPGNGALVGSPPALTLDLPPGDLLLTATADGSPRPLGLPYRLSGPGILDLTVRTPGGATLWQGRLDPAPLEGTITWSGTTADGAPAPDGRYQLIVTPWDASARAAGSPTVVPLVVDGNLVVSRAAPVQFAPQDGDRLAAATLLGFTLRRPATVDWVVVDGGGHPVRHLLAGAVGAGTVQRWWDGRDDGGRFVPPGLYRAVVTATDDLTTLSGAAAIWATPFRIVLSNPQPVPGERLSLAVVSAEPLRSLPRLVVSQTGVGSWTVPLVRTAQLGYRATVVLRDGPGGTVTFRVTGVDLLGARNAASLTVSLGG